MKKLLLIPLLLACASIVGCDGRKNTSNSKSTDSISHEIKHTADTSIRRVKTEEVSQEELDDNRIQKIEVSNDETGAMWLTANIRMDWRIFGYEHPDTNSKKMILLSVFTSDVEGNPFNCPYGSYYESSGMNDKGLELRYVSEEGLFIKSNIVRSDTPMATVYIQKKWVEFD